MDQSFSYSEERGRREDGLLVLGEVRGHEVLAEAPAGIPCQTDLQEMATTREYIME